MQEENRKELESMSNAEVIARESAKATAYKLVLMAMDAGANEATIKALRAYADSL